MLNSVLVSTTFNHVTTVITMVTTYIMEEMHPKSYQNLFLYASDEISVRASNRLAGAGIKYVGDLRSLTEKQILNKKMRIGRRVVTECRDLLAELGLSFGSLPLEVWQQIRPK